MVYLNITIVAECHRNVRLCALSSKEYGLSFMSSSFGAFITIYGPISTTYFFQTSNTGMNLFFGNKTHYPERSWHKKLTPGKVKAIFTDDNLFKKIELCILLLSVYHQWVLRLLHYQ